MIYLIAVYIVILVALTYEQSVGEAYSPRFRGLFAFAIMLLLAVMAGTRGHFGGYDIENYLAYFRDASKIDLSLADLFSLEARGSKTAFEPIWTLYNRFIGLFTSDGNAFLFVTSVIGWLLIYRHLRKYAPFFFFALMILFCRQYFQSFVYLRQALACAVVWFGVDFAYKRKLIPFLLTVFVAMNLHISGLIFIIVYPLARWRMPFLVLFGGFFVALALGVTPGFRMILNFVGMSVGNDKALGYAEGVGLFGVHIYYLLEALFIGFALLLTRRAIYARNGSNTFPPPPILPPPPGVPANVAVPVPVPVPAPAPVPAVSEGNVSGVPVRTRSRVAQISEEGPGFLQRLSLKIKTDDRTVCLFNITFLYVCASMTTLQSPGCMRLIWVFWIGPACTFPLLLERLVYGTGGKLLKVVAVLYFTVACLMYVVRFNGGQMLDFQPFFLGE